MVKRLFGNRRLIVAMILMVVTGLGASLSIEGFRWRATIVAFKTLGRIDDISWSELMPMIRPGSPFHLAALSETLNPFAVVVNPYTTTVDRETGLRLFGEHCSTCHGARGEGSTAPSLVDGPLTTGDSDWALYRVLTGGVPEIRMQPTTLATKEIWQVIAHVDWLRGLRVDDSGEERVPDSAVRIDVRSGRIERAAWEQENWLTYSGSYRSWRYSELGEIDTGNVPSLKLAWSLQLPTTEPIEASPIVVDGMMYLSAPGGSIWAITAATGEIVWNYSKRIPPDVPGCCGPVNRGVAILGSRVFVGTFDGYLVALDANTGDIEWEAKVAEYAEGYSITAAPLAVKDKIIVGVAGGEFGIRGFLDAYDAATGNRLWRFYTVPEPGTFGSETWVGNAWRTGGGPTWLTGSFDPEVGLLYWGVGNPAPNFDGDVRSGDNLFTNSVIALEAESGELAWHFQFTPHDVHDWDSNQIPVLVDREFNGEMRKLMLWANRNGFYYVLDRVTGEFLVATGFVKQNWAQYIDADGAPVPTANSAPSSRGTLTWPGLAGGTNWWSPSYSPRSDLFYVGFVEAPRLFFKRLDGAIAEYTQGEEFLGGSYAFTSQPIQVGVRALDPLTGQLRWEYARPERTSVAGMGGLLTTLGDVLFFSDLTEFLALDARDGQELWRVNLGGRIKANPVTFAVGGRQMVSIPAGNTLFVFRL